MVQTDRISFPFSCFLLLITLLPSLVVCLANPKTSMHSSSLSSTTIIQDEEPVWDPVAQIYVGGLVPENAAVQQMIEHNHGCLRIFGYGSLCWNPGSGALAHPSVRNRLARAQGYRRCWAQKSTDHRGFPHFPGIVCTLLKDEEVRQLRPSLPYYEQPTWTEGLVYEVPSELVDECLAELDFREKGGYARDIIDVVDDETGDVLQALLYRGTLDNPAIWPRVLRDLPFAAAIMSVAVGPSGENHQYLHQLDEFLESTTTVSKMEQLFDDTYALSSMTQLFQRDASLFFFCAAGSNQHDQLLLKSAAGDLHHGEDAHVITESVLCVHRDAVPDQATGIYAGGGHSALLTRNGQLYLWGWNENGQLATRGNVRNESQLPIPPILPLPTIVVEKVALGFSHTLLIERGTGKLFGFGDNSRGQVNGHVDKKAPSLFSPSESLPDQKIREVAAGLFHSACITDDGKLVTFGCRKFGQCLATSPWIPDDGSRIVQVACGRRHTVALDDRSRVWTFGDNQHGQLGRETAGAFDNQPGLVDISSTWKVQAICSGWSHTCVLTQNAEHETTVWGWGRNDKGQLGLGNTERVTRPRLLFQDHSIESLDCGSESTVVVDTANRIWSCGWNEHGNLANGSTDDSHQLVRAVGAPVTRTPGYLEESSRLQVAAGGAHILAMRVAFL